MEKLFIKANELLEDSFHLAWKIYESGYKPNYIVGVWRGGAPVGIAVQEFLNVLGLKSDHIAIRTSYYSGIDERKDKVQVYGLNYVINKVKAEDKLLVVDDVHDTGNSINQIILDLRESCRENTQKLKLQLHISNLIKTKQTDILISLFMKLINGLFFLTNSKGLALKR